MTDIRQTEEYANYLRLEGWIIEKIGGVFYFIRKFPLIGSVLKIQRPKSIDIKVIKKLEKKYRVFQTIIEPNSVAEGQLLISNGYKLSRSPYLPTKTLQIDLTQSKDKIFKNFKKDARYAINRGGSLKIEKYSSPTKIKLWQEGWRKSVGFKRYVPGVSQLTNLRNSFSGNDSLFLASHNSSGSIIGGALFTKPRESKIAYYWYAFTSNEGRSSLSQYSLLYQGILWAISMGCKVFDFEGIYDERFPIKSWLGFTHFKKSFGGQKVSYPGCYTKFRLPI